MTVRRTRAGIAFFFSASSRFFFSVFRSKESCRAAPKNVRRSVSAFGIPAESAAGDSTDAGSVRHGGARVRGGEAGGGDGGGDADREPEGGDGGGDWCAVRSLLEPVKSNARTMASRRSSVIWPYRSSVPVITTGGSRVVSSRLISVSTAALPKVRPASESIESPPLICSASLHDWPHKTMCTRRGERWTLCMSCTTQRHTNESPSHCETTTFLPASTIFM